MKRNILIFFCIVFVLYALYIKLVFPVDFLAYENFHGVEFLNALYYGDCYFTCYGLGDFAYEITSKVSGSPDNGYIPKLLYSFIVNTFGLPYASIFTLQSFLSLLTAVFFGLGIYKVAAKNTVLPVIFVTLYLTLPHTIRYGHSEDYYILGMFFVALAFYFFTEFLIRDNYRYLTATIVLFCLAIFTRNDFFLCAPVFVFTYWFYWCYHKQRTLASFDWLTIGLCFIPLLWTLYNRTSSFFWEYDKFTKTSTTSSIQLDRVLGPDVSLTPLYLWLGISLLVPLCIYLLFKNRRLFLPILLFTLYTGFFTYQLFSLRMGEASLIRHLTLILPLALFCCSLGLYFLYAIFSSIPTRKTKEIFLGLLTLSFFSLTLITPFLYSKNIHTLTSYQKEIMFIDKAITHLGNNFHLNSLGDGFRFPFFLFKNIPEANITFHNVGIGSIYLDPYRRDIWYLSTGCYRDENQRNKNPKAFAEMTLREECDLSKTPITLTPMATTTLASTEYVMPYFPKVTELPIGFYLTEINK